MVESRVRGTETRCAHREMTHVECVTPLKDYCHFTFMVMMVHFQHLPCGHFSGPKIILGDGEQVPTTVLVFPRDSEAGRGRLCPAEVLLPNVSASCAG
ncbi:hypothetical protein EVAR_78027_1 [Eumeta japonica]|uniref:Uncharacterized protein n=1 Tax=Eumeta variegata TaxID=151549 RepID=A0A4C1T319_EUMVA|nr:hypothetical protein EVAR_78027_1 [Eumeta japonica]